MVSLVSLFLPFHMIWQDGHGPSPFYQRTSSDEILVAWLLCHGACPMELSPFTSYYKSLSWYTIRGLGILFSNRVLHIPYKNLLYFQIGLLPKAIKRKVYTFQLVFLQTELEKAVLQLLLILHVSTIIFAFGKRAIYIYRRYTKILAKIHPQIFRVKALFILRIGLFNFCLNIMSYKLKSCAVLHMIYYPVF